VEADSFKKSFVNYPDWVTVMTTNDFLNESASTISCNRSYK